MLLEGETSEALSRLRDLVHAEITFKELGRQTGLGEKTLRRMLNRDGKSLAQDASELARRSFQLWEACDQELVDIFPRTEA
jgi:hypothetical protein